MRSTLFLVVLAFTSQAATIIVDPPVIFDCTGTVGKATVRWKDASGPVQVLVGPSLAPFTGVSGTSGSAETGKWVGDGLEFRLVNQKGEVEALTTAHVDCDAHVNADGLVSDSYFPLQPGNTWTYKTDSRFRTSDYFTWTITGMKRIGDRWYSELTVSIGTNSTVNGYYREEAGIVYRLSGTADTPREDLFLNPAAEIHGPVRAATGSYPDVVFKKAQSTFDLTNTVYAKGIGLIRSTTNIITGSNGGFSDNAELVEFHLASGPRVESPAAPQISLSIENTLLDVTGQQLTNCAIPCYYAACGIGSPVDPPGTYKPCARTRIEAVSQGDFQVQLTFQTRDGTEVYHSDVFPASGSTNRYVQLPLYGTGNQAFAPGQYIVSAHMRRGNTDVGLAGIPVEVR